MLFTRELLRDSALIAVTGIAFGLLANGLSPRGISLRRDYFRVPSSATSSTLASMDSAAPTVPGLAMDSAQRSRLAQSGVTVIAHLRAVEEFQNSGRAEGQIVFIDARDDSHYQAGHIPGAFQFDHYRMENYVANVLTACTVAERVVIYCTGGQCEDSALVANDLLQFGIPSAKLFLYEGGIEVWESHGMPLESGNRNSHATVKR